MLAAGESATLDATVTARFFQAFGDFNASVVGVDLVGSNGTLASYAILGFAIPLGEVGAGQGCVLGCRKLRCVLVAILGPQGGLCRPGGRCRLMPGSWLPEPGCATAQTCTCADPFACCLQSVAYLVEDPVVESSGDGLNMAEILQSSECSMGARSAAFKVSHAPKCCGFCMLGRPAGT